MLWENEKWKYDTQRNFGLAEKCNKLRRREHVENGRTKGSETLMIELNNVINRSILLRLAVDFKSRKKAELEILEPQKTLNKTTNLHECLLIEDDAKKIWHWTCDDTLSTVL